MKLKQIWSVVKATIAVYALFAFVSQEIRPSEWHWFVRLLFMFSAIWFWANTDED